MFAHPIGEVYIDLRPIVTALGAADFGPQMQKASDIALAGASDAEVTAAVQGVFDALAATAAKAPAGTASKESVDAAVLAEMLNRAALQYQSALTAETNEPFLDGFGYFEAAKARAKRVLPVLEASDPGAADATGKAISALAAAYPGIAKPKTAGIAAGEAIAATSRAMLVLTAH